MLAWRWMVLLGTPALLALSWWATGALSAPGSPDLGRAIVAAPSPHALTSATISPTPGPELTADPAPAVEPAPSPTEPDPAQHPRVSTAATASPAPTPTGAQQVAAAHLSCPAGQQVVAGTPAGFGAQPTDTDETDETDDHECE